MTWKRLDAYAPRKPVAMTVRPSGLPRPWDWWCSLNAEEVHTFAWTPELPVALLRTSETSWAVVTSAKPWLHELSARMTVTESSEGMLTGPRPVETLRAALRLLGMAPMGALEHLLRIGGYAVLLREAMRGSPYRSAPRPVDLFGGY